MPRTNAALLSFNRGEVSTQALARVDLERLRLSAEEQINWMPRAIGPMSLRPGTAHIGSTKSDAAARFIPFVFSNSDTALIEFTNGVMRVWVDDELVTRASVSTVVTNGDFSSGTGWTTATSGTGASSAISGGVLTMDSPATGGYARATRSVSVSAGDQNTEHAFRVDVTRGPVIFRCGTSSGDDDVLSEATLDTGLHSLAFTPGATTVYIQFETRTAQEKIVNSVSIEAAGTMEITSPWATANLANIRHDQSGDIVYVACYGKQHRKIERRSTTSWSIVLYKPDDGPFGNTNGTDTTMTPSVLTGNGTLTASRNTFRSTHVGALFRLFSTGQTVTASLAAQNTYTSAIRVTGVDAARYFNYAITGTWSGTLTLQRSFDSDTTGFSDVTTWTGNASAVFDDTLDNSIVWYRIGFKTGDYTSGTAVITLTYVGGGGAGICRVTGYTSRTVVDIEVLSAFSSLTATDNWTEGDWSDRLGWPSSVAFFDGRLWWAGRDRIWGSVSDAYEAFDIDVEGDSGTINRSVGFGPIDKINWLLPLSRLIAGREGAETSIRSSSFDEPLTPTNFSLKDCSTQGSATLGPLKIDTRGIFVQRSGKRVYELKFSGDVIDYRPRDLTRLNLEIGTEGFVDTAVQRQPDTVLHFVRGDGLVACFVYDDDDQVEAWWRWETDGEVENVVVLPGTEDDDVYYVVNRTINGSTKRYLEKLSKISECVGGTLNRQADCHLVVSQASSTTISGLSHLEGKTVVVWAAGKDLGTYTVTSGAITVSEAVTSAIVGLGYTARFKSSKLAYAAAGGTALTKSKRINGLGLILEKTHYQGLEYGQSYDVMDNLPLVHEGADTASNTVHTTFDDTGITVPGEWDTDSRLCLRATAPRPVTVMAAVVDITTNG